MRLQKKAILNPASTTHAPETQMNDSGEVLTDDSPNEISGLREIESEVFDSIIRQLNDELSNLNPATQPFTNSNQRPINCTSAPSPNKAPPHCRKCYHPVRGHKRLNNNTLVKCNFCENKICSVSSDTSFSKCPCSWHRANQGNQSTCSSQSATSARPDTVRISVTKKLHLDVTEWLMPSYICQSSVGGGLSGSNACTVITVLAGQHFLEETLPIPKQLQDLNCVIPLYINLMMKGNQIYQSFQLPAQQPNQQVRGSYLQLISNTALHITLLSYYIPFTGKHEPNKLTCSQLCDFIAQLVRALHRHRRGHGFESRWVTWIFQYMYCWKSQYMTNLMCNIIIICK